MLTNLFAEPRVYLLVKLHVLRVGPVYEAILYIPPSSRIYSLDHVLLTHRFLRVWLIYEAMLLHTSIAYFEQS